MLRRTLAILRKEAQDIVTNFNVSIMYLLPLGIVILFQQVMRMMETGAIAGFGVVFLAGMAGLYVPSMLIAEEREKRTLQMLMLSPATPVEIFAGKGLLTLISTTAVALVIYLVLGIPAGQIPLLLLVFVLAVAACIPLGIVIGILAPNLLSTGLVGMPLYISFTLLPMLSPADEFIDKLSRLVPTYYLFEATMGLISQEATAAELLGDIAYLLLMFGVACGLLAWIYRRRSAALA